MEQDGWQLDPTDITICKTPTGEDILIGQGGFGAVSLRGFQHSLHLMIILVMGLIYILQERTYWHKFSSISDRRSALRNPT